MWRCIRLLLPAMLLILIPWVGKTAEVDRVVPLAFDVVPDPDAVLACKFAVDPTQGVCLPWDDCEDGHLRSQKFSVTVPRFDLEVYVARFLPLPPVPTSTACPASIPACTGAPIPAAWSSWEQVVDWALNEASCLLEGAQNPPTDVNCCVALRRSGPVRFFSKCGLVGGVISSDSELSCVQDDVPGDVKIVAAIFKSNGQAGGTTDFNGDIVLDVTKLGCGYSSWAHELGHREGLSHVGSCDCGGTCCNTPQCQCASPPNPDERRIMFCQRCGRLDTFTAGECSEFSENAK